MNIKTIGIGLVVLFLMGATITVNVLQKRNAKLEIENLRLSYNQEQLLTENAELSNFKLRYNELRGKYRTDVDSLREVLRIKPKQVIKYVDKIIIQHDSIPVEVPVLVTGQDNWFMSDTGNCYIWSADVYLQGQDLNIWRKDFKYSNKTTELFYRERPKKFLFFRYGKWVNRVKVDSECGESVTKVFEFVK